MCLISATTGVSLTTLPPGSSSCQMAHSSGCRGHTYPHRIVKPNVSFVPLTMSSALCLSRLPFPGRYWAEGLHTATYLLNRLPTKVIQVACPHIALFGSAPSYEHLRVFGCACYLNTVATAPHKLAPRSTWCVFLGYSSDHKGYRWLDLSANRLIVSRHVVSDEDNFPLVVSPNLTDLYFLCESGSTVSTVGTRLTTSGTVAPCQPAPEVPPGFESPMAPLPTPAICPGFLP
jgi:hypothetical protein